MNSACGVQPAVEHGSERFFLEHAQELDAIGERIAAFHAAVAAALAQRRPQPPKTA